MWEKWEFSEALVSKERRDYLHALTATKETSINFAVCITTAGDEDLEVCKIYRILPDTKAAEVGCLRVIDESGEDYLYPMERFMVLDLSEAERERLLAILEADAA